MNLVKDIVLETDNDVAIANGDFVISESDNTHIEHLLLAHKGHYRQHPLAGVGLPQKLGMALSASKVLELKKRIDLQLRLDGYVIAKIQIKQTLNEQIPIIQAYR